MDAAVSASELFAVLSGFNPWWGGRGQSGLPGWRRAVFGELRQWLTQPPARRAVMLSGARQVGKTTLLRQAVEELLKSGVAPGQILYATFDHPLLKIVGLERVLRVWREFQAAGAGPEYLLLDEIQSVADWQTWVKHEVDFNPGRRIVVTGSALPVATTAQESGVGRWHTIKLPTLSLAEYLNLRGRSVQGVPALGSLADLASTDAGWRAGAAVAGRPLAGELHEYLLRGGFPQAAQVEDVDVAQRLLREDIVEKVLKRDMTALFNVRRVVELEKLFIYLCLHDGGLADIGALATGLGVSRQTVSNFIDLLESCNLVYRLGPLGHGKLVLRARYKLYLADAAIPGAVLLRSRGLLQDPARLGVAVESAVFKHLFTHYYASGARYSYWRGEKDREVDFVADLGGALVAFEVKHSAGAVDPRGLGGLRDLLASAPIDRAYVVTADTGTLGPVEGMMTHSGKPVVAVPAALACYWLSSSELAKPG